MQVFQIKLKYHCDFAGDTDLQAPFRNEANQIVEFPM